MKTVRGLLVLGRFFYGLVVTPFTGLLLTTKRRRTEFPKELEQFHFPFAEFDVRFFVGHDGFLFSS